MFDETNIDELIIKTLKFFKNKFPKIDNDSLHEKTNNSIKKSEFLTGEEMAPISERIWERIIN